MITFKCTNKNCINVDVFYNFLGDSATAECGGCKTILIGTDLRPDPEMPTLNIGELND